MRKVVSSRKLDPITTYLDIIEPKQYRCSDCGFIA